MWIVKHPNFTWICFYSVDHDFDANSFHYLFCYMPQISGAMHSPWPFCLYIFRPNSGNHVKKYKKLHRTKTRPKKISHAWPFWIGGKGKILLRFLRFVSVVIDFKVIRLSRSLQHISSLWAGHTNLNPQKWSFFFKKYENKCQLQYFPSHCILVI